MASGWDLLIDVMAVLAGAFLLGALMERLRLSAILGYILAGVLLGPSVTGVVTSVSAVRDLAELGVALLLFSIGLEFSLRQFLKLGRIGIGGGSLQVLLTGGVGYGIASGFGTSPQSALAIGAIVALSSTVVVTKALKDRGDLDSNYGKASVGILIFQDLAFVPLVFLLTALGGDWGSLSSIADLGTSTARLLLVAIIFILILVAFLPRALGSRTLARNRELPILLAVTVCMGAAWMAHSIGFSAAIGAFLGGMLLSETKHADQIRADVGPLRTLFATIFFASVGMLADPLWIGRNALPVIAIALAIIIGKTVLTFGALKMFRLPTITSFAAGFALAQVGELSFVLLSVSLSRNLLDENVINLLTSASVLSLLASPLLVKAAPKLSRSLALRLVPIHKLAEEERRSRRKARALEDHFVVVGLGAAGRAAAEALRARSEEVLVLEIDRRLLSDVEQLGCRALLGDATQSEILEHAALKTAKGMIVALSDHRSARMAVSLARGIAPKLPIVARSRYHLFRDEIVDAGSNRVVDEEALVGERLAYEITSMLGEQWEEVGHSLR